MYRTALALLLCLAASPALANDLPPGTILPIAADEIHGYVPADGSCVRDTDLPELAAALSDHGNFPYGRCDQEHFKLPAVPPDPSLFYVDADGVRHPVRYFSKTK